MAQPRHDLDVGLLRDVTRLGPPRITPTKTPGSGPIAYEIPDMRLKPGEEV